MRNFPSFAHCPIRKGGGVTFAKLPRDFRQQMPKKQRRLARDSAVLAKLQNGKVVVVDELALFTAFTHPPLPLEDLLLKYLRPGDIFTHMYAHGSGRTPVVNPQGQVEPYVLAAQKRGVVFDVGHGGGSFLFRQVIPATKQGFWPDVISTDLHLGSMNSGMKDILNVMSKFLDLGMSLQDVVKANTSRAAEVIKRTELGHLGVGAEADVAVLGLRKGQFGFVDSGGGQMPGTQKLECEMTVKAGQVVSVTVLEVDAAAGVLANDTDADGDTLTARLLFAPRYGQVTLNADGAFRYVQDSNGSNGSDHSTLQPPLRGAERWSEAMEPRHG
mgnify:CR=1 FL=1